MIDAGNVAMATGVVSMAMGLLSLKWRHMGS